MNKFLINIIIGISVLAFGQQNRMFKRTWDINAGLGVSNWGMPIYGGIDFTAFRDVSIGAELSFRSHTHQWKGNGTYAPAFYRHSIIGAMGNVNYHFNRVLNIPEEWDVYAGGNAGWLHAYYDDQYVKAYGDSYYNHGAASSLGFGGQIGGRYYFAERFALHLEISAGNVLTGVKMGLTMKLRKRYLSKS